MAELIAVRDYLEKAGASVSWDAATGHVVIDGTYHLIPSKVEKGKSYSHKEILDAALSHLGYTPPSSVPSTAYPSEERRAAEAERARQMELAFRALPTLSGTLELIKERLIDPVYEWIRDRIWGPVTNWVQRTVSSFRDLLETVGRFPAVVWEWGQKIRLQITQSARFVQRELIDYWGGLMDYLKEKWPHLEFLLDSTTVSPIAYVIHNWGKFKYWLDYGFDRLYALTQAPLHTIADWVIQGFDYWCEKVFTLIEDYIVAHWEGE